MGTDGEYNSVLHLFSSNSVLADKDIRKPITPWYVSAVEPRFPDTVTTRGDYQRQKHYHDSVLNYYNN